MGHVSVDQQRLERTLQEFGARWTRDAADIETYLAAQVSDVSHREVVGPLRAASGASGVDPARDLVVASHWTEEPLDLIREVSRTVTSPTG